MNTRNEYILLQARWLRLFAIIFITLGLSACGTVHFDNVKMDSKGNPVATKLTAEQKTSMRNLAIALKNLGPNTSQREATIIAHDAIVYPMILANQYGLTYPPLYHNMLVNSKKRPRGLCYQWARDLTSHLKKKNLKTFDLKWGVAYRRNYWREHNTLVVTAKGDDISKGIVLDPWRNSGKLFWSKLKDDKKYPWVQFTN
jgi:hypothetical protein